MPSAKLERVLLPTNLYMSSDISFIYSLGEVLFNTFINFKQIPNMEALLFVINFTEDFDVGFEFGLR